MTEALRRLAPTLDALVDDGALIGWVAGVQDREGVEMNDVGVAVPREQRRPRCAARAGCRDVSGRPARGARAWSPLGLVDTGIAGDPDRMAGVHAAALAGELVPFPVRRSHLTDDQRSATAGLLDPDNGWGLQVETRPDGRFGWAGGLGTIAYVDPTTRRAAFLATQVTVDAPGTVAAFDAFWPLLD